MEDAYWLAWIALYVFGIGLIALTVYPLRRYFYVAFFVGMMGVFWMLVPIPFDEVHWAPLFVTLTFQVFFDPAANYALSATAATIGSFTILAATLALYGFNFGYRHIAEFARRRWHTMRTYRGVRTRETGGKDVEIDTVDAPETPLDAQNLRNEHS